ncbi:MAG: class I tRNA ligase family protein, partial [Gammaproteobacteria bacterium]
RYLKRLWNFAYEHREHFTQKKRPGDLDWKGAADGLKKTRREVHLILKQANHDFTKFQFNTVASAGMKILNALERMASTATVTEAGGREASYATTVTEGYGILLRLLAPVCPHICDHLWRELGFGDDLLHAPWPEPDTAALQQDEVELVVQVNGKLRGQIKVPVDADQALIEQAALAEENIRRFTAGRTIRKTIIVPGRLVNIVVS